MEREKTEQIKDWIDEQVFAENKEENKLSIKDVKGEGELERRKPNQQKERLHQTRTKRPQEDETRTKGRKRHKKAARDTRLERKAARGRLEDCRIEEQQKEHQRRQRERRSKAKKMSLVAIVILLGLLRFGVERASFYDLFFWSSGEGRRDHWLGQGRPNLNPHPRI